MGSRTTTDALAPLPRWAPRPAPWTGNGKENGWRETRARPPSEGRNELCSGNGLGIRVAIDTETQAARQIPASPPQRPERSSGGFASVLAPSGRARGRLRVLAGRTMRAASPARGPAFGVARPRPLGQDFQAAPAECGSGGFGDGRASPDAHRPVAIDDAARCTPLTGGFRRAPTVRCPADLLRGEARGLAACRRAGTGRPTSRARR